MRLSFVTMLGISALSVASLAACSADTTSDPAGGPVLEDGENSELRAVATIGEKDNNKTVPVELGQSFTIALPDRMASTGFAWTVKSVDRTLGQPKISRGNVDPREVGMPGSVKFTWSTKSPLDLLGKHVIVLQQARSFTPQGATLFTVTIEVKQAKPNALCGTRGSARQCAANEYCKYELNAACGATDATGACATKPQICTQDISPVCGCNGRTYNNACAANASGVSVKALGPCAN